MEKICNPDQCTGCATCYNICTQNAISMAVAKDGFLRPVIDVEKCIKCGRCLTVCPVNKPCSKAEPLKAYMVWSKDLQQRLSSSSGGVFPAIASFILDRGGVVFGASYDDEMNVRHISINNKEQLLSLQGSKYVQSDINDTSKKAKEYLNEGKMVYFVGTPCQIAGLRNYLHNDDENLFTSDLICHGCPSNDLFHKQIFVLEKQYHTKIKNLNFRSKKRFGQGYDCELTLNDGRRKYLNAELVPYFYGFWKNITLRDCCYQCQFATRERVSDVSLSDFWTVKRYHKGIRTAKGISLCLVNTQKGYDMLNAVPSLVLSSETIETALSSQGHLNHSVKMPAKHLSFVERYSELSWEELCMNYLTPSISYKLKMRIRNIIKIVTFYRLWK